MEKELNKLGKIFESKTGIKSSKKKLQDLDQTRKENDLSLEQVEKNLEKITESQALKLTTNSIVRAGHQPSMIAFGERKAQADLARAMSSGQLNKITGHKFKAESEAVSTIFPELWHKRAQTLAQDFGTNIEMAQTYLKSLSDQDFVRGTQKYEGTNYKNWLEAQGFVPEETKAQEAQTVAQCFNDIEIIDEYIQLPELPF